MIAVVVRNGNLTVEKEYPVPIPLKHEALVKVSLAGICSTDLEILRGYIPGFEGVLGHEFCGTVVSAEDSSWVGKRVCSGINMVDPAKVDEKYRCCPLEHHPQRTVLGIINKDGCFAEYITAPIQNLVEIPDSVPDRAAVFTEPLAAALRIRDQIAVRPTCRIAVVGAGKLGMLISKVLQAGGNDVKVLTRSETSSALPRQWNLDTALVSDQADDSFDLVVEATGNIEGFRNSLRIVKPQGKIVLKSTFAEVSTSAIDMTKIVVGEITIVGSRCGPFPAAMRMLERKEISVTDLIDAEFGVKSVAEAIERAKQPGTRKVLLTFN